MKLLEMTDITKRFPGVLALDHCRFDLNSGEVHALIGENGAGKSTLMKILTGVYHKDGGEIVYQGNKLSLHGPKDAQDLGICIIHQELNLMPHLTVAQNIFIGREESAFGHLFVDDKAQIRKTEELFQMLNVTINPREKVDDLTVAMQQIVEIVKALSYDSKILVMDEPTAALTQSEIKELFVMIEKLKKKGVGIVYISHRMEELFEISDRITVMRDGQYVGTRNTKETDVDEIIKMMVGRVILKERRKAVTSSQNDVVLKVEHLNAGREVKDVSFSLRRGEILGFAGLMGAGRSEVARALFGADKVDSGEITVNGNKVHIQSPQDAVRLGIGYLSEDRKRYGLTLGMDIEENTVMANLKEYCTLGFVNTAKTARVAKEYVEKLNIKTPSIKQKTKNLSGGNQQKVIIAKWLNNNCDIFIFDEPTRGIDVGAKSEIYKLLDELAAQGKAIIMISSELPEILRMSHRVVVMCEGRITGELSGEEATQEAIMQLATKRVQTLNQNRRLE